MGEMHLTVEDGGIGIEALVEVEHVGMLKVDTAVVNLCPTGRTLGLSFLSIGVETGVAHQYTQQSQQI